MRRALTSSGLDKVDGRRVSLKRSVIREGEPSALFNGQSGQVAQFLLRPEADQQLCDAVWVDENHFVYLVGAHKSWELCLGALDGASVYGGAFPTLQVARQDP